MLICQVVSVTPAQYFKAKRGIANGIVYAGGGLGGTVISFILNALLQSVGIAWTFRILGLLIMGTGLPAAWLIKERAPIKPGRMVEWRLFKDIRFAVLFAIGAIATFPLFVPAFFLPLYTNSLGLPSSAGAGLVAAFNFSSAIGRLSCGFACDKLGSLNTLFLSLLLSALSIFVLWPVSSSIGPLVAFVVINGSANGGFFSTMPTVVGNVFGSARVSVAVGMIVSGWLGGYLMVRVSTALSTLVQTDGSSLGCSNCRIHSQCLWWPGGWHWCLSSSYFLCWVHGYHCYSLGCCVAHQG